MQSTHNIKDYKYYEFEYKDKTGYLKITENNDNFFVELLNFFDIGDRCFDFKNN